jgi:hypothetical protein
VVLSYAHKLRSSIRVDLPARPTQHREREQSRSLVDSVDVFTKGDWMTSTEMDAFDELRQLARKTAALTRAAESVLDEVIEVDDDESRTRLEDLAHLLGAAQEAANAAVEAGVQLAIEACSNRRRQEG